jgi:hypothetical protein
MSRRRPLLTALALCLVAASLSACTRSPGGHAAGGDLATPATAAVETAPLVDTPVVVSVRAVCRMIADNPDAAQSQVRGVDGAASVVVGGRGYWFFGDTVRNGPGGRQDVIPATVATSTDFDGHDCVRLQFKKADGVATPLFPRAEETTAWPDGVFVRDDGSIAFYMVKVHRDSPFAWHISSVGLGHVAAGTTDGSRDVETIWDEHSGFSDRIAGARSPVRDGEDVIVYLHKEHGGNYVARAPIARMGEAAAYMYWDGAAWQPRPQDAAAMWAPEEPASALPADNGVSVTFEESIGKWMALYNGDLATVKVRTSEHPWGPWSEPTTWLDCRALVENVYPYCYSAEPHRELSSDPSTIYLTFSSQKPYDVTLLEVHLGVAIHEWRGGDGALRYAPVSPGDGYSDAGAAFYASQGAAPGLAPVYRGKDGTYTLQPPDSLHGESATGTPPAFYAFATADGGAVHTQPVYRWRRDGHEALGTRERGGWARGDVAFYVSCPRLKPGNAGCAE